MIISSYIKNTIHKGAALANNGGRVEAHLTMRPPPRTVLALFTHTAPHEIIHGNMPDSPENPLYSHEFSAQATEIWQGTS